MHNNRFMSDAVLLPDGKVLVSGGCRIGYTNGNSKPVFESELYDPDPKWQQGAFFKMDKQKREHRYHSSALLLPNATVLSAGSTGGFPPEPIEPDFRVEVWEPSYPWRGRRISIRNSPREVVYNRKFDIEVSETRPLTVTHVVMMRLGSVTHANNMDQRRVNIEIVNDKGTGRIVARSPRDSTIAPPGPYMLFVLNRRGVPSESRSILLTHPARK